MYLISKCSVQQTFERLSTVEKIPSVVHAWLLTNVLNGLNCIFHHLQVIVSVYFAYLYFLVKHLAMNPCSSGLSSCFPGDGLPFMGKNARTHRGIKQHRETTQHGNKFLPQSSDFNFPKHII